MTSSENTHPMALKTATSDLTSVGQYAVEGTRRHRVPVRDIVSLRQVLATAALCVIASGAQAATNMRYGAQAATNMAYGAQAATNMAYGAQAATNMAYGAQAATNMAYGAQAATSQCQALLGTKLSLDGVASVVSLTATDVAASAPLPAYCDVKLVASSNANPQVSQIAIEIGLPLAPAWNGRFLGTGNGGYAGSIITRAVTAGVEQGFATGNSDLGDGILYHCKTYFCGDRSGQGGTVAAMYHKDAAINDFGYGAEHLMTLAGKQLVAAYYGKKQNYSYFSGCSTGGQNAMMEGTRFPTDYDAILAGDPAWDRTHLHLFSASVYEPLHAALDGKPTTAALTISNTAMLAQCIGKDGGAPSDTFLNRPDMCGFSLTSLQCTGATGEVPCSQTAASCTCLVPHQVGLMSTLLTGTKDSNGNILYPGFEQGIGDPNGGITSEIAAEAAFSEPFYDGLYYWALGPNFFWQDLFAATDTIQNELASTINAIDYAPVGITTMKGALNVGNNWTEFYQHGGKLIMYHGSRDPLIPTSSTYDYYNVQLATSHKLTANNSRLFLVPGMEHCQGGPGPNGFGAVQPSARPGIPGYDMLAALVAWRETGHMVKKIIATKFVNDDPTKAIAMQRPLCPYPSVASYISGRNPAHAASFTCVAGELLTGKPFPKPYGP